MKKNLVIVAAVLAFIGLIVNVAVDLDNVYDMTTTLLWVLTLVLALAGAFLGSEKKPMTPQA
jgi:hypothetical protein